MIGTWIDYSAGAVSGATMAANRIIGALVYVGIGTGTKRATTAEIADHRAHGRLDLGFLESTANRANAGFSGGVADARAALADPAAAGLPYILGTNDQPTFSQADVDYIAGLKSVLGVRVGAYGFADFLKAVRAQVGVSVYCQAGEPPNLTGTQGWVHFWQRQGNAGNGTDGPAVPTTITLDGVPCDPDNQLIPLPGGNMDWSDPLPNPIYDPANKNPADERSHPEYTVAQFMEGPWVRTLGLPARLDQIVAQLTSLQGALTADEATLVGLLQGADSDTKAGVLQVVAAIAAVPAGAVDVKTLAAALAPLLPADASPAAVGEAVVAALEAHLATPPAGGTP